MTAAELRRELLDLIGAHVPFTNEADFDEADRPMPDTGVPVSVLVVVEWQGSDGERWLSRLGILASGEDAPRWTLEMLAREALNWSKTL